MKQKEVEISSILSFGYERRSPVSTELKVLEVGGVPFGVSGPSCEREEKRRKRTSRDQTPREKLTHVIQKPFKYSPLHQ